MKKNEKAAAFPYNMIGHDCRHPLPAANGDSNANRAWRCAESYAFLQAIDGRATAWTTAIAQVGRVCDGGERSARRQGPR